jgi:hypothetical protein
MSVLREWFKNKMPWWIDSGPEIDANWSAILQTPEGNSSRSTAGSWRPVSDDKTVQIWYAAPQSL